MKQDEKKLNEDQSADKRTDTTRTERRQAVSDKQVNEDEKGTGSNDSKGVQQGTHQEGQYSKQNNKPEVNK